MDIEIEPHTDPVWQLQKALYKLLNHNEELNRLINGIYTHPPQDTKFPYIQFGNHENAEYATKTGLGYKIFTTFNIYSRSKSDKELLKISKLVRNLVKYDLYDVEGFELINIYLIKNEISILPDGITHLSSMRFKSIIMEVVTCQCNEDLWYY